MTQGNPIQSNALHLALKKLEELKQLLEKSAKESGIDNNLKEPSKSIKRLPTSPEALRIASLFSRKPTTGWSAKEIVAFNNLKPIDNDDLELVEDFYKSERASGRGQFCRHDLCTFLNNFLGEVDRARNKNNRTSTEPKLNVQDGIVIPNGYRMVK